MNTSEASTDKIVGAQMAALVRRLADGKPLTAAQLEFVREQMARRAATRTQPERGQGDYIAHSHSDLANKIGISRQMISYHTGREGAPAGLSVREWRAYLLNHGNAQVVAQVEQAGPIAARAPITDPGIAMIGLFNFFSDSLESTVTAAGEHAGVKLSKAQAEWMTIGIWRVLAELTDAYLRAHGHERYFLERDEPDADGVPFETELPPAIVALCQRIESRPKAKAKRPQCPVEQPPV